MRWLAVSIYLGLLLILTCTKNINSLYVDLFPSFQWEAEPDYLKFLELNSYPFHDPGYVVQKAGHGAAFFLLAGILYWATKQLSIVFLVSVTYAVFTEIAQLHFSRTGNLLDVGYDLIGILSFILVCFMGRLNSFIFNQLYKKEA